MATGKTNNSILKKVSEAFGLNPDLAFFEIAKGHSSTVHKATNDKETYAIHISDIDTGKLLANEKAIYRQLQGSSLPYGDLVKRRNGQTSFIVEGKYARINMFLEGNHVAEGHVGLKDNYNFGHTLALFHKHVKSLPYPHTSPFVTNDIHKHLNSNLRDFQAHARSLYEHAQSFNGTNLPRGIIHGDFHVNNGLILGDKVAMIDFEHSGNGLLIVDIARSAIDLCRTADIFSKEKLDSFLVGYNSVRQISSTEIQMLRPALAYSALVIARWFFEHNQVEKFNEFIRIGNSSLEW